jgi:hypothetical protein
MGELRSLAVPLYKDQNSFSCIYNCGSGLFNSDLKRYAIHLINQHSTQADIDVAQAMGFFTEHLRISYILKRILEEDPDSLHFSAKWDILSQGNAIPHTTVYLKEKSSEEFTLDA